MVATRRLALVLTPAVVCRSVCMLVAIGKTRLSVNASLYQVLKILSLARFETAPLQQPFRFDASGVILFRLANRLNLLGT